MPNDVDQSALRPDSLTAQSEPAPVWYSYALIQVVPQVARGERLNVGAILFARPRRFLDARVEIDPGRLLAFAPRLALDQIQHHLHTFTAIAAGDEAGGPLAALPQSERFHWLVAPRSTVIQTTPVHIGCCLDPASALEDLLARYVRW